jgi:hypothetical protein
MALSPEIATEVPALSEDAPSEGTRCVVVSWHAAINGWAFDNSAITAMQTPGNPRLAARVAHVVAGRAQLTNVVRNRSLVGMAFPPHIGMPR